MPRTARPETSIKLIFVQTSLKWLLFIIPVIVPFFKANGLSMSQILILQAAFSLGIVLFEIPSGYFSDIVGRRTTMIIGNILGFTGWVIYAGAVDFGGFFLGEMMMGLGASFISGTDTALLYDTLLEMGRAEQYMRLEGRRHSLMNFSEGAAGIAGGLLAGISLNLSLYATMIAAFITIPIVFFLHEPERQKLDTSEGNWRGILKIVNFAVREHVQVKWLIGYAALVGASTLTMVWFIQPYLTHVGLPLPWFGAVWAALQFSVGYFSWIAHQVETWLGKRKTFISLIYLSVLGYLLVSFIDALAGILVLFIFYYVRGINAPVTKHYLNELITSEKRATVLSVQGMLGRLLFSGIGPIIGRLTDTQSLSFALACAGFFFFVSGSAVLMMLHRHQVI